MAAALSGVKDRRIDFFVMMNMSVLAAVAGMIYVARATASGPQDGNGWELDAIAAVFIGGAAVSGGIGTVIGSIVGEGGYIHSLEKSRGPGIDSVRITDRFYLGEPQFRGFDIRGVGPRVQRQAYTTDANGKQILVTDRDQIVDDALGGRAYYLVRAELEIPLGSGARELGLRPSVYVQAGSLWGLTKPLPTASFPTITDSAGNVTVLPIQRLLTDSAGRQLYYNTYTPDGATAPALRATTCSIGYSAVAGGACSGSETNTIAFDQAISPFKETYYGSSPTPRVSIGIGVNWTSPFGPLRIDLAKALVTQKGDDPKLITFNVGTQF